MVWIYCFLSSGFGISWDGSLAACMDWDKMALMRLEVLIWLGSYDVFGGN